jgi:hypothetical protein
MEAEKGNFRGGAPQRCEGFCSEGSAVISAVKIPQ